MATQKSKADLLVALADNVNRAISGADLQDFLESVSVNRGSVSNDKVMAPLVTSITVQSQDEKVNANYVTVGLVNFTQVAGVLTYVGTVPIHVFISGSATFRVAGNNQLVTLSFAKNGTRLDHSRQGPLLKLGGEDNIASLQGEADLVTNDILEFRVTNDTSTGDITVSDLYFHIVGGPF